MAAVISPLRPLVTKIKGARELLRTLYGIGPVVMCKEGLGSNYVSNRSSLELKKRSYRIPPSGASMENKELPTNFLRDKMMVPVADPPRSEDIELLHQFFERSSNLVVLTGAGISTESGIPDYRSPNGAYSTGFRPITHQEFLRSARSRRRYWARSYAGWRGFTAAQPGPAHMALASLERSGRINFLITQNVDSLQTAPSGWQ